MVYLCGDCHGSFERFSTKNFPEQKEMTRDDIVICLGDCAITWDDTYAEREKYLIKWFGEKNFTFCYITGNHEGYDRLKRYPVVDFHGGKAIQLGQNVFCLKRGEIFDFEGYKFFTFGGARSHDIDGGVFEPHEKNKIKEAERKWMQNLGGHYRINHISWWAEEMPSEEEMQHGLENLEKHNWTVDYILTHDMPSEVMSVKYMSAIETDPLKLYFNRLAHDVNFYQWWGGHWHIEDRIMGKFFITYEKITRII